MRRNKNKKAAVRKGGGVEEERNEEREANRGIESQEASIGLGRLVGQFDAM